jgi:hypothetical protein
MSGVASLALAAWAGLTLVSFLWPSLPAPSDSLESWTKRIGSVVAITLSARVLWSGAAALPRIVGGGHTSESRGASQADRGTSG